MRMPGQRFSTVTRYGARHNIANLTAFMKFGNLAIVPLLPWWISICTDHIHQPTIDNRYKLLPSLNISILSAIITSTPITTAFHVSSLANFKLSPTSPTPWRSTVPSSPLLSTYPLHNFPQDNPLYPPDPPQAVPFYITFNLVLPTFMSHSPGDNLRLRQRTCSVQHSSQYGTTAQSEGKTLALGLGLRKLVLARKVISISKGQGKRTYQSSCSTPYIERIKGVISQNATIQLTFKRYRREHQM